MTWLVGWLYCRLVYFVGWLMVNGGPSKQAGWQISCLHLSILVRWHQRGSLLLCKQQLSLVCCSSSPPPQHIDKQRYIQASSNHHFAIEFCRWGIQGVGANIFCCKLLLLQLFGKIVCKTAEFVRMRGKQVAQWLVGP